MFCRRRCRIYSPKIPTSNSVRHGQERVCVVFRRTDLLHQICRLRPSWRPRTRPPNCKHGPVSGFLWHSLWRFWQNWGNRLRSKAPTCFYLQLCKFRLSYTSLHAPMCVRVSIFGICTRLSDWKSWDLRLNPEIKIKDKTQPQVFFFLVY